MCTSRSSQAKVDYKFWIQQNLFFQEQPHTLGDLSEIPFELTLAELLIFNSLDSLKKHPYIYFLLWIQK